MKSRSAGLLVKWDHREKEAGLTGEMGAHWGKLDTIEEQVRQIAANK